VAWSFSTSVRRPGDSPRRFSKAGAARVYAVDAGFGQLRGSLRSDPRVINLERTNLACLGTGSIPEPVDIVTMDLSYLSLADALPQLKHLRMNPNAHLLVLVKPTFELHTGHLATGPDEIEQALNRARANLWAQNWIFAGAVNSPIIGSKGAIEVFVHATSQ
jgi:23S rRNA (cytidine1920-2'-O)/16S rRNA (cytidine1409-2'-O)-methyltransferase